MGRYGLCLRDDWVGAEKPAVLKCSGNRLKIGDDSARSKLCIFSGHCKFDPQLVTSQRTWHGSRVEPGMTELDAMPTDADRRHEW